MNFIQNKSILLIEEKDFDTQTAFKGCTVDIIIISLSLKEKWEKSILRQACRPMLSMDGEIKFI